MWRSKNHLPSTFTNSIVPTAEAQPLDLASVGIVAVVHPVRDGAGAIAVDLDDLVGDQMPDRRWPLLAIRRLCRREVHFSQVVGSAGHELADRSAAFDLAARPIEHAVLGEHGGIAVGIEVVHGEHITVLQIDDRCAIRRIAVGFGAGCAGRQQHHGQQQRPCSFRLPRRCDAWEA